MTKCSLEMYLYNTLHLPVVVVVVVVVVIVVGNFLV
jgi:uncharacterized protein (DUF983 family)